MPIYPKSPFRAWKRMINREGSATCTGIQGLLERSHPHRNARLFRKALQCRQNPNSLIGQQVRHTEAPFSLASSKPLLNLPERDWLNSSTISGKAEQETKQGKAEQDTKSEQPKVCKFSKRTHILRWKSALAYSLIPDPQHLAGRSSVFLKSSFGEGTVFIWWGYGAM